MKTLITFLVLSFAQAGFASQQQMPTCHALGEVADAVAKINGATYAAPAYRISPTPVMTEQGAEFSYAYNSYYSPGDELPSKKVGKIHVNALIKTGQTDCKILSVTFEEI